MRRHVPTNGAAEQRGEGDELHLGEHDDDLSRVLCVHHRFFPSVRLHERTTPSRVTSHRRSPPPPSLPSPMGKPSRRPRGPHGFGRRPLDPLDGLRPSQQKKVTPSLPPPPEYAIIFDGPGGFDFTGASLKGEALEATMESLLSAIFGKLPTGVQSYDTRSCPGFKSGSFEFITVLLAEATRQAILGAAPSISLKQVAYKKVRDRLSRPDNRQVDVTICPVDEFPQHVAGGLALHAQPLASALLVRACACGK